MECVSVLFRGEEGKEGVPIFPLCHSDALCSLLLSPLFFFCTSNINVQERMTLLVRIMVNAAIKVLWGKWLWNSCCSACGKLISVCAGAKVCTAGGKVLTLFLQRNTYGVCYSSHLLCQHFLLQSRLTDCSFNVLYCVCLRNPTSCWFFVLRKARSWISLKWLKLQGKQYFTGKQIWF